VEAGGGDDSEAGEVKASEVIAAPSAQLPPIEHGWPADWQRVEQQARAETFKPKTIIGQES
jgi:hypothetical protein